MDRKLKIGLGAAAIIAAVGTPIYFLTRDDDTKPAGQATGQTADVSSAGRPSHLGGRQDFGTAPVDPMKDERHKAYLAHMIDPSKNDLYTAFYDRSQPNAQPVVIRYQDGRVARAVEYLVSNERVFNGDMTGADVRNYVIGLDKNLDGMIKEDELPSRLRRGEHDFNVPDSRYFSGARSQRYNQLDRFEKSSTPAPAQRRRRPDVRRGNRN